MTLTVRILGAELLHITTDPERPQRTAKDTPTGEFGFSTVPNYTIDQPVRRWDPGFEPEYMGGRP
ncbi:hypothetical protein AB0362_12995 [Rhodococcus sp. NPDC079359]|uniref:hypothetical protein n=1 Tax=Rhodococcus sp. NPDC079359 TaxID=3154961 RepID=UPI00344BB492